MAERQVRLVALNLADDSLSVRTHSTTPTTATMGQKETQRSAAGRVRLPMVALGLLYGLHGRTDEAVEGFAQPTAFFLVSE